MKRLSLLVPVIALSISIIFYAMACSSPSGGEGSGNRGSSAGGSVASFAGITGSEVFIAGRNITIKPFIMEDHEVTQGEYKAVIGRNPSEKKTGDDCPVENVCWYDTLVYCNKRSMQESKTPCYTIKGSTNPADWGDVPYEEDSSWDAVICDFNANGYRLPTEIEWEYMARGKNLTNQGQTKYPGSDDIDKVVWHSYSSGNKPNPVKQKQANKAGMYDMCGNVWEFCWDWSGSITESTPASGCESGSKRVIRGGGYYDRDSCTVAFRKGYKPSKKNHYNGFRVCRSGS